MTYMKRRKFLQVLFIGGAVAATGAIRQGDILVRLETEDTCRETTFERLYNETQDTIVWFWREPGFWSDQKLNSDPLPTWFERVS